MTAQQAIDDDNEEDDVPETRQCAFCKYNGTIDVTGADLFQYSTRHYAHAICLAKRHGTKAAAERISIGDLKAFRIDLREASDWDKAAIRVRDAAIARARKKAGGR